MRTALLAAALTLAAAASSAEVITPVADLVRSSEATVAGTVHRLTDEDEFVLDDGTGHVRVQVGPSLVPVRPGHKVTVSGLVDDGLRIEIHAREIVGADGTTFTFDHSY
jgi:uncharacterized protein YdeI (BOF family)